MASATVNDTKATHSVKSSARMSGLVLTAATALVVLLLGLNKPTNNWDLVGYVAVAYSADGYRGADLNKATYDSLRSELDANTFDLLKQGDYRETV
ncbi:MAG TPA: hypothetical protein VL997_15645, partial [Dyella sp.]|nr:hypothetical protein [Dyella sp.]